MTCFMRESDYFQVPDLKTLLGIALYAVVLPYINLEPPGSLPSPHHPQPWGRLPKQMFLVTALLHIWSLAFPQRWGWETVEKNRGSSSPGSSSPLGGPCNGWGN